MINPSTANNAKETETAVRAQACDHGDQDHGHADDDQALLSMRHRRTLTRAAQHPPQEVGKAGAVPLTHDRHLPRRRWLEAVGESSFHAGVVRSWSWIASRTSCYFSVSRPLTRFSRSTTDVGAAPQLPGEAVRKFLRNASHFQGFETVPKPAATTPAGSSFLLV